MRLNINLVNEKNPINIFFTSDFHLFHNNVLRFDNRPFNDVEEMHKVIESNWNEVVEERDVVIYLGDLSFARTKDEEVVRSLVSNLNGEIHFIMGNHDKLENIRKITELKSIQDYLEVRIKYMGVNIKDGSPMIIEDLFCCMHYPIHSWNKQHHGSYHVHGHTHGNLHHGEDAHYYDNRRVIDAGCMLHNYTPISYSEIIDKLKNVKIKKYGKD